MDSRTGIKPTKLPPTTTTNSTIGGLSLDAEQTSWLTAAFFACCLISLCVYCYCCFTGRLGRRSGGGRYGGGGGGYDGDGGDGGGDGGGGGGGGDGGGG